MSQKAAVVNFGRNVAFTPKALRTPRTENELLSILQENSESSFRVVGSRHAWSPLIETTSISIDMQHFDSVRVDRRDGHAVATVGAGCTMRRILSVLRRRYQMTTPTVGLIDRQTIAGAISTGTHGSGRHSISHYIDSVRLATVNPIDRRAVIRTIDSGDELRAIRCGLGCFGVIVSVSFKVRPLYDVEETMKKVDGIAEARAQEAVYPLSQFYWIPWSRDLFVHCRREATEKRSWHAALYRTYWLVGIDVLLHIIVCLLVRIRGLQRLVQGFFRHVTGRLVVRRWRVVDRSDRILTMAHSLFRHIEFELFVDPEKIEAFFAFVDETIPIAAGDQDEFSDAWLQVVDRAGCAEDAASLVGTYTHHYPICVRKVLADDTLISMASGANRYAVSFISYQKPTDRSGYFTFARFVTRVAERCFDARPHWGKCCFVDYHEVRRLYPNWNRFVELNRQYDPDGQFQNDWLRSLLDEDSAGSRSQRID